MIVGQLRLNGGGVGTGVGRVESRKVGNNADVRDRHAEVFGRDGLLDQIFDFGDILVCQFDASAGGSFQADGELAGVRLREERKAQERIDTKAENERAHEHDHR